MKRIRMRSWRRGMKEMDLILGPFADTCLARLDPAAQRLYEALLGENDQEIYSWITGHEAPPAQFEALIGAIGDFARARRPAAG